MRFTVAIDPSGPCLRVEAKGPAGMPELVGLASLVGEVAQRRRSRLALVDLASVEPNLSFTEHLQFGARAASALAGLDGVAVVVPPGYLNAPSEKAAQLAGLRVCTFLEASQAADWLERTGGLVARRA